VKNGLLQYKLNFVRNFSVRFSVGRLEERLKNILGNLLRYLYRWFGKVSWNSIYDEIQRTTDNTYRKLREVWTWFFQIYEQTDIHADTLIAILRTPVGGKVTKNRLIPKLRCNLPALLMTSGLWQTKQTHYRYGSFHMWIKVWVAGKLCHTWALQRWVSRDKALYKSTVLTLPIDRHSVQTRWAQYFTLLPGTK